MAVDVHESEPRWDVAISFSGKDRDVALQVVRHLQQRGLTVFYDESAREETVGRDLFVRLREIYTRQARCCVAIISRNYVAGGWPTFELQAAQERALIDDGYLLPIRLDDADVPSLPRSMGYASMADLDAVAELALRRSQRDKAGRTARVEVTPAGSAPVSAVSPTPAAEPLESFERQLGHELVEIGDPELVRRCRALPEDRDAWTGWRLAADLVRYLGWNTRIRTGTALTCWRTGDHVFVSILPAIVLDRPHRTLEFVLAGEGLFLAATWQSADPVWQRFGFEEYHDAVRGKLADRSGLDTEREGCLLVLRGRGAEFAFPVVPRAGNPEALCGWLDEEPQSLPFDWDRNPALGSPRIGVWGEAHHTPSDAVLLIFMVYGGWTNAAHYALGEALTSLLPGRHNRYLCGPGAMRVTVLLTTAEASGWQRVEEDRVNRVVDAVHLGLTRACAAHDGVPLPPLPGHLAVPAPSAGQRAGLDHALECLGSQEFPDLSDDWAPSTAQWLKPRHSLGNRVDLARRFDFAAVSSPSALRDQVARLEGRLDPDE